MDDAVGDLARFVEYEVFGLEVCLAALLVAVCFTLGVDGGDSGVDSLVDDLDKTGLVVGIMWRGTWRGAGAASGGMLKFVGYLKLENACDDADCGDVDNSVLMVLCCTLSSTEGAETWLGEDGQVGEFKVEVWRVDVGVPVGNLRSSGSCELLSSCGGLVSNGNCGGAVVEIEVSILLSSITFRVDLFFSKTLTNSKIEEISITDALCIVIRFCSVDKVGSGGDSGSFNSGSGIGWCWG